MLLPSVQKILLGFNPDRENFLPASKKINEVFGYISQENLYHLARYFSLSPAEAFSAVSFFDDIRIKPKPNLEVKVCMSTPCELNGAKQVLQEVENFLGTKADRNLNVKLEVKTTSCQGRCQRGPLLVVNGNIYEKVRPHMVDELLAGYFQK